jgi:hypothetical protein
MDLDIPTWLIVIAALGVLALLGSILLGVGIFLFKVGVAINEARKPPHLDTGDYRLDQGREARFEAQSVKRKAQSGEER